MKVRLNIRGTAPLIMHNIRLADPLDPIVRAIKEVSKKRTKTDEDLLRMARLEFEGGLYFHEQLGPYVPGANVEKSIVEGARITKQGKQVERGLFVTDNECPLIYAGPRTVEQLWSDENFVSRMMAAVQRQRIARTRPIFRDWSLEVIAELDTALLNLEGLQQVAGDAGNMVGIGDYRPRYGRFEVLVERV